MSFFTQLSDSLSKVIFFLGCCQADMRGDVIANICTSVKAIIHLFDDVFPGVSKNEILSSCDNATRILRGMKHNLQEKRSTSLLTFIPVVTPPLK